MCQKNTMTSILLHGNKTWLETEHTNFNTLYDQCNGKMPVDIFEMLFNHELRRHLVHETLQYAKVSHNDTSFTFSEDGLRKYIGVLLFSGHHILPQPNIIGSGWMT